MADDYHDPQGYSDMTTQRAVSPRRSRSGKKAPRLTLLWHPNPARVGDSCALPSGALELSRLAPVFGSQPLLDPFVSRKPVVLTPAARGAFKVERGAQGMEVELDGARVTTEARISASDLERGATLVLAGRVALLLHLGHEPLEGEAGGDAMGLIGASDALAELRSDIALVAGHDASTLVRGETGSGKELVARAIHDASARRRGPFVAVNIAAIPRETAISQLFGHVRGAFTGASSDHPGYFGQADGGTLFLDEIGEASAELQASLLRALETGEVQPIGARGSRRVDVRLVAATDADLEGAVRDGRFGRPLLHRLAGLQLDVPSLRARPDDVGRLLVAFLREELDKSAGARGLEDQTGRPQLRIEPALVAEMARYHWPGNVRELKNLARHLAVQSQRLSGAALSDRVRERFEGAAEASTAPGPALEPAEDLKPEDIDEAALIEALSSNKWSPGATAKALGISRTSLYKLMEQSDRVKIAGDLSAREILKASAACGGDTTAMAEHLEVSRQGLRRRMKELGL